MRRTWLRLAARLLLACLLLILVLCGVVAVLLWRTLPGSAQTAAIPGLSAPVDIRFDADGIPRIRAANALDGAAALGFAHARDRMFQMDLMRRAAAGELSEIVGSATLGFDRTMRVLGLARRAAADYAALPGPARAMLDAYARGVNAWIAARGRFSAPEFLVLGTPRAWEPSDSLLWAKTMGLYLSENWRTELARLSLAGVLPPEKIDELWPPDRDPGHPEARAGPDRRFAQAAARVLAALPDFPGRFTQPPSASNEWAVDGAHSATGAPLLAGDPHLAFSFPGIWYVARIDTRDGVLAGATAPGVPFVVLGRNAHVAWTFTTTGADVQDVFIETPTADGGYLTPDGPAAFVTREERIKVRSAADQVITVRETRHGPVISDLNPAGGKLLAVTMANLLPGDTAAAGLLALNQATSVEQAGQAAAMITSPIQNMLVADRNGIGLFVTGRVPIRRGGDGSAPVPGASGAFDWIGFAGGVSGAAGLPHIVAPASGRLVNANERIAPPDYPVFLGRDWFGDWRAARIRALLDQHPKQTVVDFTRMQVDTVSVYAVRMLPRLRAVPPPAGAAGQALALLTDWDGSMAMDKPQPLIFNAWIGRFREAVLRRAGVPEAAAGPAGREFIAYVLSPEGAAWCGGDCTRLLSEALVGAATDLAARFGPVPAAWRWGQAHPAVFAHPLLSHLPLLGGLGTLSIASPGDDTTLDRGGTSWTGFESVHGASFRAVYDLADLDRSRFMMAPGESGNLLSRHARDFLVRWRDGDTISLGPDPASVAATITLTPAGQP